MPNARLMKLIQVACAAAMLCGAGVARAEVPATGVAHMEKARARFMALIEARNDKSRLPKLSESDAAPVLKALFDTPAILGTSPYTIKSLREIQQIHNYYFYIHDLYVELTEGETAAEQESNMAVYEAEVVEFNIALLRVLSAFWSAYENASVFLVARPEFASRQEAWRSARAELVDVVELIVGNMAATGIGQANQIRMATTLSEQAPAIGKAMQMEERETVIGAITANLGGMPDARASLEAAVAAIKEAPCEGTCRLKADGKI